MKPKYMNVMVIVSVAIPENAQRWQMERKAEAIAQDITEKIEDDYNVVDWDNFYRDENDDVVDWKKWKE